MNRGIILALSAYIFWGLHPIYWKLLRNVPSVEIVSNRIIWSALFFAAIVTFSKNWKTLFKKIETSPNKFILFVPAFLIGSNWALYIWAVNSGFIIETSLGYFISPIISVFLGVIFLNEHLRKVQWLSVAIAALAVLTMTCIYGQFPWISLYLAGSWGTYGLLRKKSILSSVEGLTLETVILSLPALIYLSHLVFKGTCSLFSDLSTSLLLVGAGVISGLPLLIFIISARMIKLSLIGILQYIYPSMIFIIGFFVYHEPLTEGKMSGFIFIWIAIILYTIDESIFRKRKEKLVDAKSSLY